MQPDSTSHDARARLKVQAFLARLVLGLGVILLVMMIVVESEPGALPLLLVLVGGAWTVFTRARLRALQP